MKTSMLPVLAAILATATACAPTRQEQNPAPAVVDATELVQPTVLGGSSAMMPKAIAYKTNGDYNQHVFVTLNDDGTQILSYPDPRDVSEASTPIELGDGWLLDRRGGIGRNAAFLNYTYSQYSQLSQVPSREQLMDNIIPNAKVTEVEQLPINAQQAITDPAAAAKYLKR